LVNALPVVGPALNSLTSGDGTALTTTVLDPLAKVTVLNTALLGSTASNSRQRIDGSVLSTQSANNSLLNANVLAANQVIGLPPGTVPSGPLSGVLAPVSGVLTPVTTTVTSITGGLNLGNLGSGGLPTGGVLAPVTGLLSGVGGTGVVAPVTGLLSGAGGTGVLAPVTGLVGTVTGTTALAPVTGILTPVTALLGVHR
jgi:hypothetical protein